MFVFFICKQIYRWISIALFSWNVYIFSLTKHQAYFLTLRHPIRKLRAALYIFFAFGFPHAKEAGTFFTSRRGNIYWSVIVELCGIIFNIYFVNFKIWWWVFASVPTLFRNHLERLSIQGRHLVFSNRLEVHRWASIPHKQLPYIHLVSFVLLLTTIISISSTFQDCL